MSQLHIHETSTWTVLFDANQRTFFSDYERFNGVVAELERRGREDLLRQGFEAARIGYRLELDMRYGNQRVETAVVTDRNRLRSLEDVLDLIGRFHSRYGERFGQGSQAEAGVRINTIRVCSFVTHTGVAFRGIRPAGDALPPPPAAAVRDCHFVGVEGAVPTTVYDEAALRAGTQIDGPAIVVTSATTYLIEPGWRYRAAEQNAVWFTHLDAGTEERS